MRLPKRPGGFLQKTRFKNCHKISYFTLFVSVDKCLKLTGMRNMLKKCRKWVGQYKKKLCVAENVILRNNIK